MKAALVGLAALLLWTVAAACSGGDGKETTETSQSAPTTIGSSTPNTAATPLPPDPQAAVGIFRQFVDTVQAGDLEAAWSLYAASIEGTTEEHDAAYGCDFGAFSFEFPRMQHLFARVAPFEVSQTFGAAPGSLFIEMRLLGAEGTSFLGTVVRVQPLVEYRVQFLNSGEVSEVPGAPDPQPSPDDPLGVCGIWTGAR